MPEQHSVTVLIRLGEKQLEDALNGFASALRGLGFSDADLSGVQGFQWKPLQEEPCRGFVYGARLPEKLINLGWLRLGLRPLIIGRTANAAPGGQGDWIELSILFKSAELEDKAAPGHRYPAGVGKGLWTALRALAPLAWTSPVILETEGQDVRAIDQAILTGDIGAFELALVPQKLIEKYTPVPSTHTAADVPEGLAVASNGSWDVLPWVE